MLKEIKPALFLFLFMTILTGLAYPMFVTGSAKILFPGKSSGSMIEKDGKVLGSELIGQQFNSPGYFHPRPSAAGEGYDAMNSSASNLSQSDKKLEDNIAARFKELHSENPDKEIPVDLLTTSASGLDPHISPQAANFQVPRIAKARNVTEESLVELIEKHTEGRFLGIFGEPRVNVLFLNVELGK